MFTILYKWLFGETPQQKRMRNYIAMHRERPAECAARERVDGCYHAILNKVETLEGEPRSELQTHLRFWRRDYENLPSLTFHPYESKAESLLQHLRHIARQVEALAPVEGQELSSQVPDTSDLRVDEMIRRTRI